MFREILFGQNNAVQILFFGTQVRIKSHDRSQSSGEESPVARKARRADKLHRALLKCLVQFPAPTGDKAEFDEETLKKLTSSVMRLSKEPSRRAIDRMTELAKRVVYDLEIARQHVKQESQTNKSETLIRDLIDAATKMRAVWSAAFEDKQIRQALNNRIGVGLIKIYDRKVGSEKHLREIIGNISEIDIFAKFSKRFNSCIDVVINATTPMKDALDAGTRIQKEADHHYSLLLASGWLRIFGEAPTFLHLDGKENEQASKPSPFHSFVNALPLDEKISAEAIRGAVETVQE